MTTRFMHSTDELIGPHHALRCAIAMVRILDHAYVPRCREVAPVKILSHKPLRRCREELRPDLQAPSLGHERHAGGGVNTVIVWN